MEPLSIKQSDRLRRYYQAYADWLDAGAPQMQPFRRNWGLCANVYLQLDVNNMRGLEDEMFAQFQETGLNTGYPFGDKYEYWFETENHTHHLNTNRTEWVRDRLEQT